MADLLTVKVKDFIRSNNLLEDGASVVVGVSGGADSTALLLILLRLGYRVHVAHCNFHLRGAESERDQQFVTDLCNRLGIELEIFQYDTQQYASDHGISIEMAARELRYADFGRIMQQKGASAVCIAHHRDDSVETMLLNLIRGTGIKGLTGIKPRNGHIIRPLLCLSRQEIEDWLHGIGQTYVTDSTNLETDYTRNRIRLQLLPMMRSINPDVANAIAHTAEHLQQAYTIYRQAIDQAAAGIIAECPDGFRIDIQALKQVPQVQAFLFEILSPLGFNSSQIKQIAESADSQPGPRFSSATYMVWKERDSFLVSRTPNSAPKQITIGIVPGTTALLPDGRMLLINTAPAESAISRDPQVATFDADMLHDGRISIRKWRDGDWFIPFGMKGRKLLSDYLTDCKISAIEREHQLVVTHGNDIIWVIGHRSDNRYRVTAATKLMITLELK